MATISGKNGKVIADSSELADITHWMLETRSHNPAYASSSTGGFRRRVAGVKEASGTIAFKLDPDDPISDRFDEGDDVTLLLHLDATRHFLVPALIESLRFEVDIATGDVLGGVAAFSSNGAWVKPEFA